MNAATRIVIQGNLFRGNLTRLVLSKETIFLFALLFSILISGLLTIYVKDLERRLIGQIEMAEQMKQRLQIEWGQLLLEQSTLVTQWRVQKIASQNLEMIQPQPTKVIVISK